MADGKHLLSLLLKGLGDSEAAKKYYGPLPPSIVEAEPPSSSGVRAQQVLLPSESQFICQCEQDLEKRVEQSVSEGKLSLSDDKEGLSLTEELTQRTN